MLPYRDSRAIRILLGLFFLVVILYALFEARGLLYGPIIYVPEEALTVTEPSTVIRGTAERITELSLNGTPIPVTEEGAFEELFLLTPGSNHLILEARDQRGRRVRKEMVIIYNPAASTYPSPSAP